MMRVTTIGRAVFAAAIFLMPAGCKSPTSQADCNDQLGLQNAAGLSTTDSDWRTFVLANTDTSKGDFAFAVSPGDSVEVVIRGLTDADSSMLQPYGGRVFYSFASFEAVGAKFSIEGLRAMANDVSFDPENRIKYVDLPMPREPLCR